MWRGYIEMRKLGSRGGKKTISATTRQLESIIRLSEAHARMRLSRTVDEGDVREALRLMHEATQMAAMDPRTGTIDMEMLTTGHTCVAIQRLAMQCNAMQCMSDMEPSAPVARCVAAFHA